MRVQKASVDMTEAPFLKKIIVYAIPVILSGFLQQFYSMADLMVVGQFVSPQALASVGASNPVVSLSTGLFLGLAVGGGVAAAHAVGSKKYDEVEEVLHTSIILAAAVGLLVAVFGIIFAPWLLRLMETPEDIIDATIMYIRIVFVGIPAQLLYNYCAAIVRASGDAKRPFYFLVVSGFCNVVLNLVFVLAFDMGVFGVALATAISHYVALVLIMVFLTHKKDYLRLSFKKIRFSWAKLKRIIAVGLPSGFQTSLFSISNATIQAALNGFGTDVIAGNTASNSIMSFITMSMHGVYEASVTFVGQNFGAKKYKNLKGIVARCVLVCVVVGLSITGVILVFRRPIFNIFANGAEVVYETALTKFMINGVLYFIYGIFDVLNGALRGMGKSVTSMLLSVVGIIGFRFFWLWTFFKWIPTLECLYWSYPISWALSGVFALIAFAFYYLKYTRSTQNSVSSDMAS